MAATPVRVPIQQENPRAEQALLPIQSLAHLDLGLLHRAGPLTFDLFARGFDARMALWLGAVLVGTGMAGLRGRCRRRTGTLHHPLHRGSAQSAVPPHLLHVRLERGDHVRGAEYRRPR